MELIDYLKVISSKKVLIIILMIVITASSVLVYYFMPEKLETSVAIAIAREGKQETQDYKYDGFYSLQASELFADTVVSWFLSPEIVNSIYDGAGIDLGDKTLRELSRVFDAEKMASQNVLIKFTASNSNEASQVVDSMKTILSERTQILNKANSEDAKFTVIIKDPITVSHKVKIWVVTLISIVVSFFVSLFIAFLFEYIEKAKK